MHKTIHFPLPVSHEETQALCSVRIALTENVVSLTRSSGCNGTMCMYLGWQRAETWALLLCVID